jgi:hypothetical protein
MRRPAVAFVSRIATVWVIAGSAGCIPSRENVGEQFTCQPVCGDSQICNTSSGVCVLALPAGALCPGPDGGICTPPLVCGAVTQEENRCSIECTTESAADVCSGGQSCFARPAEEGGFCVTPVGPGDVCDTSHLVMCDGTDLICVAQTQAGPAGECFVTCQPSADNCTAGQTCADPWAPGDPTLGICATPEADNTCDYTLFHFCPRGDTCARTGGSTSGYCHPRCSPSTVGGCPSGDECLTPWADTPDQGICVSPQPLGGQCDGHSDLWCGENAICVYIQGAGTECALDCTGDATVCDATGQQCKALGNGESACI